MTEERYCSNCRAAIPPKESVCPACGVYAGDLYDARVHRPRTRFTLFGTLLVLALAGGGAAIWWNTRTALPERGIPKSEAPRTRVVRDRPGGNVGQAEAIRLARRHLVATLGVKSECVAILGRGFRGGGYVVSAHDRCSDTRMGQWRVDARSGEVSRAR